MPSGLLSPAGIGSSAGDDILFMLIYFAGNVYPFLYKNGFFKTGVPAVFFAAMHSFGGIGPY